MKTPSLQEWVFSVKAFAAALLALYIALSLGLDHPYWAMVTVYVVANPFAGATVSKSLDRVGGTLLGAAGAVAIVGAFNGFAEIMIVAIAVWCGLFLFFALHDRTPRNYSFMLAAYTPPLILLPVMSSPETILDVALVRCAEIIIGAASATAVNVLFYPLSVQKPLVSRLRSLFAETGSWSARELASDSSRADPPDSGIKLLAGAPSVDALLSQLPNDPSGKAIKERSHFLYVRLQIMLPLVASIRDRLGVLYDDREGWPLNLVDFLARLDQLLRTNTNTEAEFSIENLHDELTALDAPAGAPVLQRAVWQSLTKRLGDLIDIWADCRILDASLEAAGAPPTKLRYETLFQKKPYHNRAIMLFVASSTAFCTLLAGLLWLWSGWNDGAYAVSFVAIALCFFGGLDRPLPQILKMMVWATVAFIIAFAYTFAILPQVPNFVVLALALAPPFLLIGTLIPRPEVSLIGLITATNLAGDLGLQGAATMSVQTFLEGGLSVGVGLLFAAGWTVITRSWGEAFIVRRMMHTSWRDIARLASGSNKRDRAIISGRSIDHLAQIATRSALEEEHTQPLHRFAQQRAAYAIIALRRQKENATSEVGTLIDRLLRLVTDFYQERFVTGRWSSPPEAMRTAIDDCLIATYSAGQSKSDVVQLDALIDLRLALFSERRGS